MGLCGRRSPIGFAVGDDKAFLKHPTNLPKSLKPTIDL